MRSAILARPRRPKTSLALTGGVALLAGFGALALGAVAFVLWPRWPVAPAESTAPSLPITVAGVVFNVPPAAIRVPAQRASGPQSRLDLMFEWPALVPPASAARPPRSDTAKPDHLFIAITEAREALPLLERVRTIYPRYIGGAAFSGPGGLTGVPFRDGTPYQGEDLFLDAEQPERFTARCSRPNGPMDGLCLFERQIGGAEITVRFPRGWLSDWRALGERIDGLLARLAGAPAQK
ncbi:MAG TPA: hypothetical protein VFQ27_12845 [Xanthobacteraceae bacterium]|nr:hypothetical protein [Xanthobacteraceae bacterium]